jgi:hypothetical protein
MSTKMKKDTLFYIKLRLFKHNSQRCLAGGHAC